MEKEVINQKANEIFEKTKNEHEKYKYERQIIFKLMQNSNSEHLDILENVVNLFEKISKLEQENEKFKEIKRILEEIKEEQTRKTDNSKTSHLFLIQDKNKQKYGFFTRDRAKMFATDNPDLFLQDVEIEISEINNIDLDKLIQIVM